MRNFPFAAIFVVAATFGCTDNVIGQATILNSDDPSMSVQYGIATLAAAGDAAIAGISIGTILPVKSETSCVAVSTEPAVVDPNVYPYTVTVNYTSCAVSEGSHQSGDQAITVAQNGNIVTTTVVDGLSQLNIDTTTLTISGNPNVTVQNSTSADGNTVTRVVTGSSYRRLNSSGGAVGYETVVNPNGVVLTDTYNGNVVAERTFSGAFSLKSSDTNSTTTLTLTGVSQTPTTCCYPTAGSIAVHVLYQYTQPIDRTYVFTSTCGTVQVTQGTTVIDEVWTSC